MMLLPLLILVFCAIVILSVALFLTVNIWSDFYSYGKPSAFFVGLPHEAVSVVVSHMDISDGAIIYDLGSRDGRILISLQRKAAAEGKNIYGVGIEKNWLAHLWARFNARRLPGLKFIRANMFDVSLSESSVVYCYLSRALMDALLPKLEGELRSGTLLYVIDFPFSNKEPFQEIDLGRGPKVLGHTLYVYRF